MEIKEKIELESGTDKKEIDALIDTGPYISVIDEGTGTIEFPECDKNYVEV